MRKRRWGGQKWATQPRSCSVLCWVQSGMQRKKAALKVVTSRQGMPDRLGEPPFCTTSSHYASYISQAQAGTPGAGRLIPAIILFTTSACSGFHRNGTVLAQCCKLLPHLLPHSLMVGLANEAQGPGSDPGNYIFSISHWCQFQLLWFRILVRGRVQPAPVSSCSSSSSLLQSPSLL